MDQNDLEEDATFDSLIQDMKEKLTHPAATPTATEAPLATLISWVDDRMRGADDGVYTPDRVLIGPLHRNPSHWMEQKKKNLLYSALLPIEDARQREQFLRKYLEAMVNVEARARRFYYDYETTLSSINREAFACMLLLDGYFVLSCFALISQESRPKASDLYLGDVVFLLENQVPFFVLENIYRLVVTDGGDSSPVVEKIASHIEASVVHHHAYVHRTVTYRPVVEANLGGRSPCHLLHLLYAYFWPTVVINHRRRCSGSAQRNGSHTPADVELGRSQGNAPVQSRSRWRSATYYYAAGVRLAKRELDGNKARSILDIDVKDGTLHVPCLMIDGNTFTILRNLVALEQQNPDIGSHVAAYCHFLSKVASTEDDVRLLSSKGIIVRLGKDGDVAEGFADLCSGVILNMSNPEFYYLKGLQEDLEKLCQSRWRKSMAWLRHNKCNNILMTLAVAAAVILFVCTVEQSVFSALSYATGK